MNRDTKKRWTLALGLLAVAALLAGCTQADEETTEEDVGEGLVEPEPDVGPQEEAVQPQEPEQVGNETPAEQEPVEGGGAEVGV